MARTRRRRAARHASLVVVVVALAVTRVTPAGAHVAILLEIIEPGANTRTATDVDLRVYAQRTYGGVDRTTFTVSVDGRPFDPRTGRPARRPHPLGIRVNQTKVVALRGLRAGQHSVTITYRPDIDATAQRRSVTFTAVASRPPWALASVAGIVAVIVLVVAGYLVRVTRRRATAPEAAD